MDTSTGSFTDCPSADVYKEQKFCTTDQIGFTHQWLQAILQFFLMQPPTNCQGSEPFPNFALFTTLPGRVRLSQSVGCQTNTIVLEKISEIRKDRMSIFGALNPSIDAGCPCIPTLYLKGQRGTYSPPNPPLVKMEGDRHQHHVMNDVALVLNGSANRSTGSDHVAITFAPLSLETVYALADDSANGAIVVMSGMVRNQTDGKPVVALEYQAYEPMALNIFNQIAADIRQTWPEVTRVVIHHRTGKLQIGEISVLVAVGCPHRGEAFAACQYAIDTLKHNAPIWKKEHWADGSTSWVSIGACEQPGENC